MLRLTRKQLLSAVAILVLLLIVVYAFRPSGFAVDTGTVTSGPLMTTVDDEGKTRVRDRYTVSAPVGGRLLRPSLRAGDRVTAGMVVAMLEPAPLDSRSLEQARTRIRSAEDAERVAAAGLVAARAALAQASRLRQRAETLAARGLVAPEERERSELAEITAEREVEAADFRTQAAGHDVETARAAVIASSGSGRGAPFPVKTPVAGRVLRLIEESERVVSAGAPIMEVGNPASIEIVADLLSADAVQVSPGDTILVEAWGGDTPLKARLRSVEPSGFTKVSALGVEEQRVNIVGDLLDQSDRLGDRYRVEVRIVVWQADKVLRVPVSALIRNGGKWAVYRVVNGKARLTPVEVGHRSNADAEVLKGLA
ncbi:MAG TPA: HlyD family efflux transporter periplasmic adaptor subunit, partial [Gemmatimonadales bacterium]|nr:HlyD family efflux transporter periplasmic adaptor subunit [Gemmatimonadales bacterium]